MQKPKIAVVGAGLIGKEHIQLIDDHNGCELAAIVDPTDESIALASRYNVAHFVDIESLIDNQTLDGAIIATPNHLHVDQALQCIDAGLATLIEKPVAHTVDEGKKLLEHVKKSNARCLVGHHRYHSETLKKARLTIEQEVLGKLVAITGTAMFYKPDIYFQSSFWRIKKGGGPILINLIHEIGSLRYLCGEITHVQAMASNSMRQYEVEDTVSINLRFANGALGTFILSDVSASTRSWEQTSGENKAFAHDPNENCYVITGTRGALSIPTMQVKHFQDDEEHSWKTQQSSFKVPVTERNPLISQLGHFCDIIEKDDAPLASVEDGLRNLMVLNAISEAASTNRMIEISSI